MEQLLSLSFYLSFSWAGPLTQHESFVFPQNLMHCQAKKDKSQIKYKEMKHL